MTWITTKGLTKANGETTSMLTRADLLNEPSPVGLSGLEGLPPWFGAVGGETGPQRRNPVPAGSAGDVGRPTSRQRHFSRRSHREPQARGIPVGER